MRLSGTDLLPVLAIIGGGAVGLATSASLLSSRSNDGPAPVRVVAPPATTEPERRLRPPMPEESPPPPVYHVPRFLEPRLEEGTAEPLIYIDGVRMSGGPSSLEGLNPERVDRIEVVKGGAAVTRYGQQASGGVIQIFLKHESALPAEPDPSAEPTTPPFTVSPSTHFTLAPSILNRQGVVRAIDREYPSLLRDAGIGGQVEVFLFIDESGEVRNIQIETSSGHQALDDAALRVADVYRFSPALNRDQRVPVWVQLTITFQVR